MPRRLSSAPFGAGWDNRRQDRPWWGRPNCRQNSGKQTELLVLVPTEEEHMVWEGLAQTTTGERAPEPQALAWAPQRPPEPVGNGEEEAVGRAPSYPPFSGVHGPFNLLLPARPCPQKQDPTQPYPFSQLSLLFFDTIVKSSMAHIPSALIC